MLKCLTLSLCILFGSLPLMAQDGLVGFEWTFTNSDIVRNFKNTSTNPDMPPIPGRGLGDYMNTSVRALQQSPISLASQAWISEIKKICTDCIVDRNKIYTPDGFWFKITMDQTVLEVLTEPMTYPQLVDRAETLDRLIWKPARRLNIVPHKRLGGGHLHLDIITHFGDDRTLFRNFVVDLVNRPELFMGGFGLNYFNAPPLSFYGPKALKTFKEIISNFDADPKLSTLDLMNRINDYYETLEHPIIPTPSSKFQALNFKHFETGTLELRGIRPQISVEHAIRLVNMFQSRIGVLSQSKKLLKPKTPDHSKAYSAQRIKGFRIYTHSLGAEKILTAVESYAKAGGLKPDFYNLFVTEELQKDLKLEVDNKIASGSKSAGYCGSFL